MRDRNIVLSQITKPPRYRSRLSTIGTLFVAILLVVVFEGAFRKWITPALTGPLVLVRDIMALYGFIWAIKHGHVSLSRLGGQVLLLWSAIVVIWGLLQLIVNQSSPFIFIVGVRFWLLYLWFAYAAAVSLTEHDFYFIAKTVLITLLVMTPLAVVQHFLPPSSFLNRQIDGDESTVFRLTADIVRTTGTFSFTLGYAVFLALATPLVLAFLSKSRNPWKTRLTPKVALLALAIATIVSGSRGAIILFGIMFAVYVIASLVVSKGSKRSSSLLSLVVVTALIAALPYFFPRSMEATQERFETAAEVEDISDRILSIFVGEPNAYEGMPLMGHGLGVGSNFAGLLMSGERSFLLAETEAARTILEGGLLGFMFIGLKLVVIISGLRKSLYVVKSTGNSLPLMLWITTSIALLSWAIVGQLTTNAIGYLLFGLAIASLRFCRKI